MVGEMAGSYWLALIFQTSHVISEVGVVQIYSQEVAMVTIIYFLG